MWDLVPWPGIIRGPPALGVPSLSHRTTREFPWHIFFACIILYKNLLGTYCTPGTVLDTGGWQQWTKLPKPPGLAALSSPVLTVVLRDRACGFCLNTCLFIFGRPGSSLLLRLCLVVTSGGHSLVAVCWHLIAMAALTAEQPAAGGVGSVAVAHESSCSSACGIFLDQGLNPCTDRQILNHWTTREIPRPTFYRGGKWGTE